MINWKNRRWLLGVGICVLTAASYAQWSNPADDVPAYHPSAPLKVSALPPILSGAQLTGENFRYPWQVHVYQQAAKISSVIYQLPCNCRCDRALGHTSLRSCYEDAARHRVLHLRQGGLLRLPADQSSARRRRRFAPAIARHEYESIDLEKQ